MLRLRAARHVPMLAAKGRSSKQINSPRDENERTRFRGSVGLQY